MCFCIKPFVSEGPRGTQGVDVLYVRASLFVPLPVLDPDIELQLLAHEFLAIERGDCVGCFGFVAKDGTALTVSLDIDKLAAWALLVDPILELLVHLLVFGLLLSQAAK